MKRILGFILAMGFLAAFAQPLDAQTTICVPQFADGVAGGFQWRTTVSVFNANAAGPAAAQWQFFAGGGGMFGNRTMSRRGGVGMPTPISPCGAFNPDPIQSRIWAGYRSP